VRAVRSDSAGRLDPVELRHLHVHHDHLRLQLRRALNGLETVPGGANNLHPVQRTLAEEA
jgi:hypothetical protein